MTTKMGLKTTPSVLYCNRKGCKLFCAAVLRVQKFSKTLASCEMISQTEFPNYVLNKVKIMTSIEVHLDEYKEKSSVIKQNMGQSIQ